MMTLVKGWLLRASWHFIAKHDTTPKSGSVVTWDPHFKFPSLEVIERMEACCLEMPQVSTPCEHKFAPGVYYREAFMPAGSFIIGHQHKHRHLNVALSGSATVLMNGQVHHIKAPCVVMSEAGVRKVFQVHEDLRWATIHPTAEFSECGEDVEQVEEHIFIKSQSYLNHHRLKNEAQKTLKA